MSIAGSHTSNASRPKRGVKIPLAQLQEDFDAIEESLKLLLSRELSSFENINEIKDHGKEVKTTLNDFNYFGLQLLSRLKEIGANEEREVLSNKCINRQNFAEVVIDSINARLQSSGISQLSAYQKVTNWLSAPASRHSSQDLRDPLEPQSSPTPSVQTHASENSHANGNENSNKQPDNSNRENLLPYMPAIPPTSPSNQLPPPSASAAQGQISSPLGMSMQAHPSGGATAAVNNSASNSTATQLQQPMQHVVNHNPGPISGLQNPNLVNPNIFDVNYNPSPPPASPSINDNNSLLATFSKHLLQQEFLKQSIEPFDGKATYFWPWAGKIKAYLTEMNPSPMQVLQFMESNSKGRPQLLISQKMASHATITGTTVQSIWNELIFLFGSSQKITKELFEQIEAFPPIKAPNEGDQLYSLYLLCEVIQHNMERCPELSTLNLATGLKPIRSKLSPRLQFKWGNVGQQYENANNMQHPTFKYFLEFLKNQATLAANAHYEICYNNDRGKSAPKKPTTAKVLKTTAATSSKSLKEEKFCHYHKHKYHDLSECRDFRFLPYKERKDIVTRSSRCTKCLGGHPRAECNVDVKCDLCDLTNHVEAMHIYRKYTTHDRKPSDSPSSSPSDTTETKSETETNITAKCTKVCADRKSDTCSKTVLVEITLKGSHKSMLGYAIVDEHASEGLIDETALDFFGKSFPVQDYVLGCATQSLVLHSTGRLVDGLLIRGVLNDEIIELPPTISCKGLSDTKDEVATPDLVRSNKHIAHYASKFPKLNEDAQVVLLIGRNCDRAMATKCHTTVVPYVHETPLGFALVGNPCPFKTQSMLKSMKKIRACRTKFLPSTTLQVAYAFPKDTSKNNDVFEQYPDDEELAHSQNDKKFLETLSNGTVVDSDGNLELPLPLKTDPLPDNRAAVFARTSNTLKRIKRDAAKLQAVTESMQKNISNGYIEQIPLDDINNDNPKWHLNIFDVTHPKKKKPRMVFDGSACYDGASINDALLQGPDLNNKMQGVFLRFREHPVAYCADVQDMFNNFRVPKNQRDLLRFYWFRNNDPSQELVLYRARTHIFGLKSSPGVASYALKLCALRPLTAEFHLAQNYIHESFYVDDGIGSTTAIADAVQTVSKAVSLLSDYNIRLHKILSNKEEVMNHFPEAECATVSNKTMENPSVQRALGIVWDTKTDSLVMEVNIPHRPFTKRGILSAVSSIWDPQGLAAPVTLTGKLFQREMMLNHPEAQTLGWDDPLPLDHYAQYDQWLKSLATLSTITIPRCFYPEDFDPVRRELHVFCDASDKAIGFVSYMRTLSSDESVQVTFLNASSKVAPRAANSMPRLELCAGVDGSANASSVITQLSSKPDSLHMYTDSQIVMGYLSNKDKRFTKYVERRVSMILHHTSISDWSYISTKENPADMASRPQTPSELLSSNWLTGPGFLWDPKYQPAATTDSPRSIPLPEEKTAKSVLKTKTSVKTSLILGLSQRFSRLERLIGTLKNVLKFIWTCRDRALLRKGHSLALRGEPSVEQVTIFIVKQAQADCFQPILKALEDNKCVPDSYQIATLSPFLDPNGVMRVGGRLKNANITFSVKHPALIPKDHPLASLIIDRYHRKIKHQGSHLSHGQIIQAGFFIESGRQLIRAHVKNCVTCKRLRAPTCSQFMADLPADRLEETPPFSNVGLDVFGPFHVTEGKSTRGRSSTKKLWAVIFVCLPSRAVHIEPLESMDTSSFRNALSRFTSLRGACKLIRSDQGTNFVSAKSQLEGIHVDVLTDELKQQNIEWILNPPHASHHGGAWERKIGSIRRILDSTMAQVKIRGISRDEFYTLLAQASSIVNQTPLWTVPNHPDDPSPLTPAMLVTLRDCNEVVQEEFSDKDLLRYGKLRYRRVQFLAHQFWNRWREEYLHTLTARHKWKARKPCAAVGDVVLLRDKQAARNDWPMGRISEVKVSQDGLVRSVTVELPPRKSGARRYLTRPISELVLLVPSESHKCK